MNSVTTYLSEMIVDNKGHAIAKKVQEGLKQQPPLSYGKSFYRQVTKDGDSYAELLKTFNNISFTNDGVQEDEIFQGRYAGRQI